MIANPRETPPTLRPRPGKRQLIAGAIFVGALLATWLARRGDKPPAQLLITGPAFSTVWQVKVVATGFSKETKQQLQERIEGVIESVDAAMSRFRTDSAIARFNRHRSTDPFPVSKETAALLHMAKAHGEKTNGAFDITVGPLLELWGFYGPKGRHKEPSDAELGEAVSKMGLGYLEIDLSGPTIRKHKPDLQLDLSAVAKGYTVDKIAKQVESAGFHDYLVEIGGEIRSRGRNARGTFWRIGIERPIAETRETYQVIELRNKSVATSGDYRNFYQLGGKTVSHTIDPRSARPISHGLASVSVVHSECAVADAYATGLTVLGPKEGYALAERLGLPALFLLRRPDGSLTRMATQTFEQLCVSRAVEASR